MAETTTKRVATLRGFKVDVWQPMFNRTEGNIGSMRVVRVVASNRQTAILEAAHRYYWPDKLFMPPERHIILSVGGKEFFIAFFPYGAAVGKIFLVQAQTKRQVWAELPGKIGKNPAWVERIATHRAL